jgi:hypothetical protein
MYRNITATPFPSVIVRQSNYVIIGVIRRARSRIVGQFELKIVPGGLGQIHGCISAKVTLEYGSSLNISSIVATFHEAVFCKHVTCRILRQYAASLRPSRPRPILKITLTEI